jgi:predicted NBD/HSP70 family sugar kinase
VQLNSHPAYTGTLTATSLIVDLSASAKQGDALAQGVIEETAGYLARGLVNLICNFDPELVILSGFVVWDCPALLEGGSGSPQECNRCPGYQHSAGGARRRGWGDRGFSHRFGPAYRDVGVRLIPGHHKRKSVEMSLDAADTSVRATNNRRLSCPRK